MIVFESGLWTVALSDDFVAEAESRWPGTRNGRRFRRATSEYIEAEIPLWEDRVWKAITRMEMDAFFGNSRLKALKSITAVEPYLDGEEK